MSESLLAAAKALVDSVSFDDNGALLGGKWQGGHGGLLSDKTRKAADALRLEINRHEAALRPRQPDIGDAEA
jgi:hypothetical protein